MPKMPGWVQEMIYGGPGEGFRGIASLLPPPPTTLTLSEDDWLWIARTAFKVEYGTRPLELRNIFTGRVFWVQRRK